MGFKLRDYETGISPESSGVGSISSSNTSGTLINITSGKGLFQGVVYTAIATSDASSALFSLPLTLTITVDGGTAKTVVIDPLVWKANENSTLRDGRIYVPINARYKTSLNVAWAANADDLNSDYAGYVRGIIRDES
jgi:hypothetical protein